MARQFAIDCQDAPAPALSRLKQFEVPAAPRQLRRQGQSAQASADDRRVQHVALRMICDIAKQESRSFSHPGQKNRQNRRDGDASAAFTTAFVTAPAFWHKT
jgi:hypothetical protein